MSRKARGEYLDSQTIQIAHITSRCVRRAYLCGLDPVSGISFEHRRQWICNRLEFLASQFGIDCLTYAVMRNHIHLVLRNRPDIVRTWSDEEIAERWLTICPPRRGGKPVPARDSDRAKILKDPQRVAELRVRLSDISWWMRLTCQPIAQRANREDDCTGRFWEGRFKAQLLLDEAAILACSMYVDLNPIRAAIAQSLEDSEFTGAKARIDDLKRFHSQGNNKKPIRTRRWERSYGRTQSGWLSPLEINEAEDPIGPDPCDSGRRASLKGFLPITLAGYLELLDWTGRQLKAGKRGSIPDNVAPILIQLGLRPSRWLDLARNFGRLFRRASGSAFSLANQSEKQAQNWLQAPGKHCFV